MSEELMIEIKDVKKRYRLGQITSTTLQHDLQSWWALKRGKEDPNQKIGSALRNGNTVFYALDGVSFKVNKGETIGLIGQNGAGKSTLLKLLARVTAPTEGTIMLNGRITSMLEVGTGFDGELTGRENIYMNGAILGMTKAEIDEKIDDIIDFSELREFIDTPVKRYSSGMHTKLGFAVASHLDSEIMIMDEVLAVGDIAFQNKCITKMREAAAEEGKTVLYVSHNMNQIRQLCQRCIVLKKGKVLFDGPTDQAIDHYLEQFQVEQSYQDYRDYLRPKWYKNPYIKLLSAQYKNHDSITFSGIVKMVIHMVADCYRDFKGLSLRVEISSANNIKIGTYILYDICDCRADTQIEFDVDIDISGFVDANYNVIYTFFMRDEFGNMINIDCVRGLSFTCSESIPSKKLIWDINNWGYMELPGAEISNLSVSEEKLHYHEQKALVKQS